MRLPAPRHEKNSPACRSGHLLCSIQVVQTEPICAPFHSSMQPSKRKVHPLCRLASFCLSFAGFRPTKAIFSFPSYTPPFLPAALLIKKCTFLQTKTARRLICQKANNFLKKYRNRNKLVLYYFCIKICPTCKKVHFSVKTPFNHLADFS